ncbi:hypothetical protein BKP45_01465 [Anaerobacillus alkalidiazotrophicus]|uniref:Cytochrome c domain-containing protein n=1 Tax=Anaerobacillus alkalidiazotrophicus TaxID=472963 RepID=A0A1S2MA76_9BACI|nr:beta-propeller fold lactonase family protein [Anaerobacillus alkalidiazotrophicus]OIJ21466.1 hypothetical protein BKP45_01465 [Anaerobacillus alkalidiazotrophicus]
MRKRLLLISSLLLLLLTACTNEEKTEETADPHTTPEVSEDHSLDLLIAGGTYGSEYFAVVAGGASNKILIFDAKYRKLVTAIDTGGPKLERTIPEYYPNLHDVHAMTFTNDFSMFFTVNWFDYDEPSYVLAYDTKTLKEIWRTPVGKGGHHAALSPDEKFLYVANDRSGTISIVDIKLQKEVDTLHVGEGADYITPTMYWDGIVIDTPYLFATVNTESKVVVFDWKTNEIIKEIIVGETEGKVHGVNLTPDGKTVWVAVGGDNTIVVIDVETLEITNHIQFENRPIHISFSPDGEFGYVTTGGHQIYKVNTTTHDVVWNQTGTIIPAHMAVSPDGKELWTLNHGMSTERYPYLIGGRPVSGVQIWDTETGELLAEMPSEGPPHEIQFVPYHAFGLQQVQNDSDTVTAEGLYQQACSSCHGGNLEGGGGPSLKNLSDKITVDEVSEIILKGSGMMPDGLVNEGESYLIAEWLINNGKDNDVHSH